MRFETFINEFDAIAALLLDVQEKFDAGKLSRVEYWEAMDKGTHEQRNIVERAMCAYPRRAEQSFDLDTAISASKETRLQLRAAYRMEHDRHAASPFRIELGRLLDLG